MVNKILFEIIYVINWPCSFKGVKHDLILGEEHRRSGFDSRTLRKIFGLKKEEITGGWRELYNEFVICVTHHILLE